MERVLFWAFMVLLGIHTGLLLTACSTDNQPVEDILYAPASTGQTTIAYSTTPCSQGSSASNRFNSLLGAVQTQRGKEPPPEVEPCEPEPEVTIPESCPAYPSSTNHPWYDYLNCDGQLQRTETDFMYSPDRTDIDTVTILVVVDSRLPTEGLSIEEFVQNEFDFANQVLQKSRVYLRLRIADIRVLDVDQDRNLTNNIKYFGVDSREFANVTQWQIESDADLAYLFLNPRINPTACGAAYLDATGGFKTSRGAIQCYQNSTYSNDQLRYYNRANETFVHEVGHNLGLDHDWQNAGKFGNIFDYSYGYVIPGTTEVYPDGSRFNGWGTIMSYADEPTGKFSDPERWFQLPDGTSERTGTDGGCFCMDPIEQQPPPTNAVEHLNRVRYVMSQLAENRAQPAFFDLDREEEPALCIF